MSGTARNHRLLDVNLVSPGRNVQVKFDAPSEPYQKSFDMIQPLFGRELNSTDRRQRSARLAWLCALAAFTFACTEPVKHDEMLAGKRAIEFARAVLIDKNMEKGYELLSESGRRHVPFDKFKQTIEAMNARGRVSKVIATDYEPMPGEKAIYIFLRGQNVDEQSIYRITLQGTAATDYKVLKIDQGASFPTLSNQKRKFETPLSWP